MITDSYLALSLMYAHRIDSELLVCIMSETSSFDFSVVLKFKRNFLHDGDAVYFVVLHCVMPF